MPSLQHTVAALLAAAKQAIDAGSSLVVLAAAVGLRYWTRGCYPKRNFALGFVAQSPWTATRWCCYSAQIVVAAASFGFVEASWQPIASFEQQFETGLAAAKKESR